MPQTPRAIVSTDDLPAQRTASAIVVAKRLIELHTLARAARLLGISRHALAAFVAGAAIRPGTRLLLEQQIAAHSRAKAVR